MPSDSSQLQFSRPLTEIARDYQNDTYIGDDVIQPVPVEDESFAYEVFSAARAFVRTNDTVDQNGNVPETISKSSTTTGRTVDHAMREPVNALAEHAGQRIGYSPKLRAMKSVMNDQDLNNEGRVVDFLNDDANFVASRIITAGAGISPAKWDAAGGLPLQDITAMKDLLIVPPGSEVVGVCSRDTWSVVSLNASVVDAVKYTMIGGLAEVGPIAAKLGLADIKIGGAWSAPGIEQNDDETALAAVLTRMWGTAFFLIVRASKGSIAREQPAFAYNFRLKLNGSMRRVYEYQAPSRGGDGSQYVQVAKNDILKSVGKLYGSKIKATWT